MYLTEYSKQKKGWFDGFLKIKIQKTDIAKLIAHSEDEKLIETIRYLYNLNDYITPYDLYKIEVEINKILETYYDQIIKGQETNISKVDVEKLEKNLQDIMKLRSKYDRTTEIDEKAECKHDK